MHTTTSRDGTRIAFDRAGDGPPLVLVAGAFSYRNYPAQRTLVELLAPNFTVINYDRRGRGDSTDTPPYSVEREVEDLAALIATAGAPANVWGLSSGGALALAAVGAGLPITALALQEPPFVIDPADRRPPADMHQHLTNLIADGRRGEAVKYFLVDAMGAPRFVPAILRLMPGVWRKLTTVAHTLPYDAELVQAHQDGRPFAPNEWASITVPSLVMCGTPKDTPAFLRHAAAALATALPDGRLVERKGLGHTRKLNPAVIADTVAAFLASGSGATSARDTQS
jgi:Alpha/beta hydrolase family